MLRHARSFCLPTLRSPSHFHGPVLDPASSPSGGLGQGRSPLVWVARLGLLHVCAGHHSRVCILLARAHGPHAHHAALVMHSIHGCVYHAHLANISLLPPPCPLPPLPLPPRLVRQGEALSAIRRACYLSCQYSLPLIPGPYPRIPFYVLSPLNVLITVEYHACHPPRRSTDTACLLAFLPSYRQTPYPHPHAAG